MFFSPPEGSSKSGFMKVTNWVRSALAAAMAAAGTLASPGAAPEQHRHTRPSWERFVRSPKSRTAKPTGIIYGKTIGNVTNPGGMVDGQGLTVLTRVHVDEAPPTVVVDFGLNVVGILEIDFAGSHDLSEGLPGLRLAFSETMEYLTNRSDFTRSGNAAGVSGYSLALNGSRSELTRQEKGNFDARD